MLTALAQERSGGLTAEENTLEIDVDDPIPIRLGGFCQGAEVDDTGGIDEGVQAPKARLAGGYGLLDRCRRGDIEH